MSTFTRKRAIADIMLVVTYSSAVYGATTGGPYLGGIASAELMRNLGLRYGKEWINPQTLDSCSDEQLAAGQAYVKTYLVYAIAYYNDTEKRIAKLLEEFEKVKHWMPET